MNKKYVVKWQRYKDLGIYLSPETKIMGGSPYSVYEWHRNGEVFYVGMGKYWRFKSIHPKSRSKEFLDMLELGDCEPRVIACGMEEKVARQLERDIIAERVASGCKLVNKQYVVDYYHTPAKLAFYEKQRKWCRTF